MIKCMLLSQVIMTLYFGTIYQESDMKDSTAYSYKEHQSIKKGI